MPTTRHSDPSTSHDAAASVTNTTEKQRVVLMLLHEYGPMTDHDLLEQYDGMPGLRLPYQSQSGIRTRRAELVDRGLAYDTGERRRLPSGRRGIVWASTREGSRRVGG